MRVGALEVLPVFDGYGHEQARDVLTKPGADGDPWAAHADQLDSDGNLVFTLGGFLLRAAGRTVLIDAGAGMISTAKYAGGGLLDSLRSLGTGPGDITDVVFTHLHFDHVGWATRKGEIVFPNATYRVHQADWEHFVDSPAADPGAVRKLSPLADRLEPFTTDTTLAPGLDTRHTPGHTPGSTVFVISSEGQRALLIGDVAHSIVELTEPEWEAVFDVDAAAARAARAALAGEAAGSGDLIAPAHGPGLRFGRLITVDGKRRWIYA